MVYGFNFYFESIAIKLRAPFPYYKKKKKFDKQYDVFVNGAKISQHPYIQYFPPKLQRQSIQTFSCIFHSEK